MRTPRGWPAIVASACLGVAMIVLPAFSLPSRAQLLTGAGLLLVAADLATPITRWRRTATLAAVAAVAAAAIGERGNATLAAEGALILGYVLLSDAPGAMSWRAAARWLRQQVPAAVAAVFVLAAVLAVFAIPVPVSAWLVVAGAGAAVAATLVALPRQRREPREPS